MASMNSNHNGNFPSEDSSPELDAQFRKLPFDGKHLARDAATKRLMRYGAPHITTVLKQKYYDNILANQKANDAAHNQGGVATAAFEGASQAYPQITNIIDQQYAHKILNGGENRTVSHIETRIETAAFKKGTQDNADHFIDFLNWQFAHIFLSNDEHHAVARDDPKINLTAFKRPMDGPSIVSLLSEYEVMILETAFNHPEVVAAFAQVLHDDLNQSAAEEELEHATDAIRELVEAVPRILSEEKHDSLALENLLFDDPLFMDPHPASNVAHDRDGTHTPGTRYVAHSIADISDPENRVLCHKPWGNKTSHHTGNETNHFMQSRSNSTWRHSKELELDEKDIPCYADRKVQSVEAAIAAKLATLPVMRIPLDLWGRGLQIPNHHPHRSGPLLEQVTKIIESSGHQVHEPRGAYPGAKLPHITHHLNESYFHNELNDVKDRISTIARREHSSDSTSGFKIQGRNYTSMHSFKQLNHQSVVNRDVQIAGRNIVLGLITIALLVFLGLIAYAKADRRTDSRNRGLDREEKGETMKGETDGFSDIVL